MRNLFRFQSLHFRLSALYVGVFCASVIVLGFVISIITQNFLMDQLRAHIESNRSQLMGDYLEDGLPELRHDIQERIDSEDPERLWYFLVLPNGKVEFDPIQSLPEEGWHEIDEKEHHLLLLVVDLEDGYRLGIASTLDKLVAGKKAVQRTFLWAVLATIIIGGVGGALVSRSFIGRVERLKRSTIRFGDGDLKYRIPLKGNEDEFDQISTTLNAMFMRIETLVSEVQRVTSNIAHDLRTPLGRVKQKLESIQQRNDLAPVARQEIDQISSTVDGMLDTFTALMRIAEVELGTRRAEFKLISVQEILDDVASAYDIVVEESGRSISFHCEPGLQLYGDRVLMIQILVNLVENAIQHTPIGTKVRVDAQNIDKRLQIIVSDNGAGVPAEERKNVTKPFYKLDRSRASENNSGLGLSLVAAVVKLHDATLSIEDNQPGMLIRMNFPNRA